LDGESMSSPYESRKQGDPKELGLGHEVDGARTGRSSDGWIGIAGVVSDEQHAARFGDVFAAGDFPTVVEAKENAEKADRNAI